MPEFAKVTRHSCNKKHRSYKAMAECAMKGTAVQGNGRFGITHRHKYSPDHSDRKAFTTLWLFDTIEDAGAMLENIENDKCGGTCRNGGRRHSFIEMVLPGSC